MKEIQEELEMKAVIKAKLKLEVGMYGEYITVSRRGDESYGGEARIRTCDLAEAMAKHFDGCVDRSRGGFEELRTDVHEMLDAALLELDAAVVHLRKVRSQVLGEILEAEAQLAREPS